ncbi:MAG: hypothetical protein AB9917_13790 [Negativicutes bacterium]
MEERFEATCCVCGNTFFAARSIAQRDFGMNDAGHGHCPKCNEFLNMAYKPELQRMETMKWDDYVRKMKAEGGLNGKN